MNKNFSIRSVRLEYLRYVAKTVAVANDKGEYEIKSTQDCQSGDIVFTLGVGDIFIKTKIY